MGLSLHRVCELHELSGCLRPIVAARAERLLFSEPVVQIEDLGDSDRLLPASTGRSVIRFVMNLADPLIWGYVGRIIVFWITRNEISVKERADIGREGKRYQPYKSSVREDMN